MKTEVTLGLSRADRGCHETHHGLPVIMGSPKWDRIHSEEYSPVARVMEIGAGKRNGRNSPDGERDADARSPVTWSEQLSNLELLEQRHVDQLIEFQIIWKQYLRDREQWTGRHTRRVGLTTS